MSNQNQLTVPDSITIDIAVGVDRFGGWHAFGLDHVSFEDASRLVSGRYPGMQVHRVRVTLDVPKTVMGEVVNLPVNNTET